MLARGSRQFHGLGGSEASLGGIAYVPVLVLPSSADEDPCAPAEMTCKGKERGCLRFKYVETTITAVRTKTGQSLQYERLLNREGNTPGQKKHTAQHVANMKLKNTTLWRT